MQSVSVGQIWIDRDKRMNGRLLIVRCIKEQYAYCGNPHDPEPETERRTRLRLDTLRTRFRLIGAK